MLHVERESTLPAGKTFGGLQYFDPHRRPTVIINFTRVFRQFVLLNLAKKIQKISIKNKVPLSMNMGLGEGIIDDSCHVLHRSYFLLLFHLCESLVRIGQKQDWTSTCLGWQKKFHLLNLSLAASNSEERKKAKLPQSFFNSNFQSRFFCIERRQDRI